MGNLRAILGELVGLFVDDGSLALALLVWCAIVGAGVVVAPGLSPAGGGLALLLGCVVILLANVGWAARARATKR
ncbi:MAG TPA: hypothetical protein DDZ81_19825 [Acetobacteraceae bacterium]|jgi:hypothetical protein|nr:hypothetical protein [Acetobacteraceae bacterium]